MADQSPTPHSHQSEPAHPPTGGKTLGSIARPRYKSWRKKYRKIHAVFSAAQDDNKRLFREESRLENIAKRLRQELDGLLEICLDMNSTSALPPHLRYDISRPKNQALPNVVPPNIPPDQANGLLSEYQAAVQEGRIPQLDLHVIRGQIEARLTVQGVAALGDLEERISHAVPSDTQEGAIPEDLRIDDPPGYLTSAQESAHLNKLDTKGISEMPFPAPPLPGGSSQDEKHPAELTARELERQMEHNNPLSQHNWLRLHTKLHPDGEAGDTESLASHDTKPAPRKRGGGGAGKNLAKQVGDKAFERARDGGSGDEDELGGLHGLPEDGASGGSARGKKRDPDSTYRIKGGGGGASKNGATAKGGKRKRSGEEVVGGSAVKKGKMEGEPGVVL